MDEASHLKSCLAGDSQRRQMKQALGLNANPWLWGPFFCAIRSFFGHSLAWLLQVVVPLGTQEQWKGLLGSSPALEPKGSVCTQ